QELVRLAMLGDTNSRAGCAPVSACVGEAHAKPVLRRQIVVIHLHQPMRVGDSTDTTVSPTMRGSGRGLVVGGASAPAFGSARCNVQICCSRGLLGQFSSKASPSLGANINWRARLPDGSGSCEGLSFVHWFAPASYVHVSSRCCGSSS